MIRALAIVAIVVAASAVESDLDPALHRDDRRAHALGGLAIGALSVATLETIPATRDLAPWKKVALATLTATAVGVAKELTDGRGAEYGDAVATGLGGAVGAVGITFVFRF